MGCNDGATCKDTHKFPMILKNSDTVVDTVTDTGSDTVMDMLMEKNFCVHKI